MLLKESIIKNNNLEIKEEDKNIDNVVNFSTC